MAPQKSKVMKENLLPIKVYKLLTEEEIKANAQKYEQHIGNLNESRNYINEICSIVPQLDKNQCNLNKWQEYVNCFPLPKPYIPSDVHLFMEKLKYFENMSNELNTINWQLFIDERSILAQNFKSKDLTRSALKAQNFDTFGSLYDQNIDKCLKMLQRISNFLKSNSEAVNYDVKQFNDINAMKTTLQQQIVDFLNRFTYNILCSEEAYMNSIDAVTAEYSIQTNNFQMHIWTLKNVPIRFEQLENCCFKANLYGIKVLLSIPTFIMKQNFTIRALHLDFDHITKNYEPSFQEVVKQCDSESFLIEDLTECLAKERLMQLEILKRVHNNLIQIRQEYEEKKQQRQEELKMKNKVKKATKKESNRKKQKSKKPSANLQLIEDNMFPNIWDEFLEEEQKRHEEYLDSLYSPLLLNLDTDEINLNKYFILGGIYQLYQMEKPQHFDANNFNMTWHFTGSKLKIVEDLTIPLNTKFYPRSSRIYRRSTRKSLSLKIDEFNEPTDKQCPWFSLTIELPEYLCYWGQPITCHYVSVTKVQTRPIIVDDTRKFSDMSIQLLKTLNNQTVELTTAPAGKNVPFLAPQREGLTDSILNLQQPSKENFLRSSLSNIYLSNDKLFHSKCARDSKGILNIRDFPLTSLLTKSQIRQLERHVVPRMISSYKFKKEIQEDKLAALKTKETRTKAGTLIKKFFDAKIEEVPDINQLFSYGSMQNNPERLIPIYKRDEPIRVIHVEADTRQSEVIRTKPKSFADLVKSINFIKWWHKAQVRKIIDLQPFKTSFPVINKRLETLEKQKLTTFFSQSHLRSNEFPAENQKLKQLFSKTSLRLSRRSKPQASKRFTKMQLSSKMNLVEPSGSNMSSTTTKEPIPKNSTFSSCLTEIKNMSEDDSATYTHTYWTTEHILQSEFDRTKRTIVIQTNRLGNFGFVFKKYEHFPFKCWSLEPSGNEHDIIFTLDTQHVRCIFSINESGLRCRVTEPITKYLKSPKMYLIIDEPISNLNEVKRIFQSKHLNIFPDKDASFYIENGYFSEKHLPTERHTYDCMAMNCTQIKFSSSIWNPLAQRRDLILKFLQYQDQEDNTVEVRITPEESFFVETSELCSNNLDVIKLNFNLTWRNITMFSDLNNLVLSMYPMASYMRCKNAKLMNILRKLLSDIRPLSFS